MIKCNDECKEDMAVLLQFIQAGDAFIAAWTKAGSQEGLTSEASDERVQANIGHLLETRTRKPMAEVFAIVGERYGVLIGNVPGTLMSEKDIKVSKSYKKG